MMLAHKYFMGINFIARLVLIVNQPFIKIFCIMKSKLIYLDYIFKTRIMKLITCFFNRNLFREKRKSQFVQSKVNLAIFEKKKIILLKNVWDIPEDAYSPGCTQLPKHKIFVRECNCINLIKIQKSYINNKTNSTCNQKNTFLRYY